MFDPPDRVPYSKIEESKLDSPEHRNLARRVANESMVLLKNDGVLPLKSVRHMLVVGPLADQSDVLLGNYNGTPTHTVSVLEGLKQEFPTATISYLPGTQFLSNSGDLVPASVFSTADGRSGLEAEYRLGLSLESPSAPIITRVEPAVSLNEHTLPEQVRGRPTLAVRWSGFLDPNGTGEYLIGVRADGAARVAVDGKQIMQTYSAGASLGRARLERGRRVKLEVEYEQGSGSKPEAQLIWAPVDEAPDPGSDRCGRAGRRGRCRPRHHEPPRGRRDARGATRLPGWRPH